MDSEKKENNITIRPETFKVLNTIRKWAMFLAIIGFIITGIIVIMVLFTGLFLSFFKTTVSQAGFPEWLIFIPLLLTAIIYFMPVLCLFRFSKYTSEAVKSRDDKIMHKAFRSLKYFFMFIGVLVIIFLAAYVIAIIAAGASFSFLKNLG